MADMMKYFQENLPAGGGAPSIQDIPVTIGAGCTNISNVILQVNNTTRVATLSGTATFNRASGDRTYNCFTIPAGYRPLANAANINASTGVYSFTSNCLQCVANCVTCKNCPSPCTSQRVLTSAVCPTSAPSGSDACNKFFNESSNGVSRCIAGPHCAAGCTTTCVSSQTHSIPAASRSWIF